MLALREELEGSSMGLVLSRPCWAAKGGKVAKPPILVLKIDL
jgi:hypothetical protein